MRRKDREITDTKKIEEFLSNQKVIRLGFYDKTNEEVYIVPLNFGYTIENGNFVFYCHGAKVGRKYELSKDSPNIGFEIDGLINLVDGGDIACKYSCKYQSVIGNGKISIVDDIDEKKKGFCIMMKHLTGRSDLEFPPKSIEFVALYKIVATKLSCKGNI